MLSSQLLGPMSRVKECGRGTSLIVDRKQRNNSSKKGTVQDITPIDMPPVTHFLQPGRKFHHLPIIYSNFKSFN
jgi:hypothetical protein